MYFSPMGDTGTSDDKFNEPLNCLNPWEDSSDEDCEDSVEDNFVDNLSNHGSESITASQVGDKALHDHETIHPLVMKGVLHYDVA